MSQMTIALKRKHMRSGNRQMQLQKQPATDRKMLEKSFWKSQLNLPRNACSTVGLFGTILSYVCNQILSTTIWLGLVPSTSICQWVAFQLHPNRPNSLLFYQSEPSNSTQFGNIRLPAFTMIPFLQFSPNLRSTLPVLTKCTVRSQPPKWNCRLERTQLVSCGTHDT